MLLTVRIGSTQRQREGLLQLHSTWVVKGVKVEDAAGAADDDAVAAGAAVAAGYDAQESLTCWVNICGSAEDAEMLSPHHYQLLVEVLYFQSSHSLAAGATQQLNHSRKMSNGVFVRCQSLSALDHCWLPLAPMMMIVWHASQYGGQIFDNSCGGQEW